MFAPTMDIVNVIEEEYMEIAGIFEKVSYKQFKESFPDMPGEQVNTLYENLELPCRATKGSAGYDFFTPYEIALKPGETIKIPTGVRVKMNPGWVLHLYPRSGLGFKYRLQLDNTVGIIDSDYYNSDNEGHIFAKITNDSRDGKTLNLAAGKGFMQGIFLPYGITADDEATAERNGGFGSTNA